MTPKEIYHLVLQKQKEKNNVPLIVKKILAVLEEKVKTKQKGDIYKYYIDLYTDLEEYYPFYNITEVKEALQKELGDYATIMFSTSFKCFVISFKPITT